MRRALFLLTFSILVFASRAQADFEIRAASFKPESGMSPLTYKSPKASYPVFVAREVIVSAADIEKVDVLIMNPEAEPTDKKGYGLAIKLHSDGGEKLKAFTASHLRKPIAVIVDGKVVSVPVIMDPLYKELLFSGYTLQEADSLKKQIEAN